MKKVGTLVLMLISSHTWGQTPDSFVFSDPTDRQNSTAGNHPLFRDLTPNPPRQADPSLSPYINEETVITDMFFRSILFGMTATNTINRQRMQGRFGFTEDQELVLNRILTDWSNERAGIDQYSTMKMCEYWAQPGLDRNYETALLALDVKTVNRPPIDEFWRDIDALMLKIEQEMGREMADLLTTELDRDLSIRAGNVSYDTLESAARAQGNAFQHVDGTCNP